ncbi:HpcH/HpaI aldolase/citrate lyase family protein [Nocardia sp. alder85J]|uniref:HpcH/HpaI aldolase/citrate lyase family protein n=1 Tax=Nocardia sp. alder85J TaxID=2862949 RepID=UPI00224E1FBE|nr:CoA ester lyase [Nocardia sp. alder85J]MCX4090814.1 CoA ester lyase [Nocardia sp. alder85J]
MRRRPHRARRSELATPASNESMCAAAARSGADLVFLDLEDACAPSMKQAARSIAVRAFTELDWGRTTRAVRINGLDTPWCHDDLIQVVTGARDALDVIIVPKARSARDVWWVDVLLTQLESKLGLTRPIGLEILIEEAEGLLAAAEIAKASPRVEAIIFGVGDLSAALHARVGGNFRPAPGAYPGDFWHFARVQVLAAARAAGVDAIDSPYPDYADGDGYRADATQAALLGFDGKWAIHPSQVPIANEVFTPTPAEVAHARALVDGYRAAQRDGVGALGQGGQLVDAGHLRLAENILRTAELAGTDGAPPPRGIGRIHSSPTDGSGRRSTAGGDDLPAHAGNTDRTTRPEGGEQ